MKITLKDGWIAAFGDVHGAWDAMYAYCEYAAAASRPSEPISLGLVLQCGDIGLFSRDSILDKATSRFAMRDPTELGAVDFLDGSRPIPIPTLFVRGNHEDFSLLPPSGHGPVGKATGRYHIYGALVQIQVAGRSITIAGVGGITRHSRRYSDEMDEATSPARYITRFEVEALQSLRPGSVDILIAHDGPAGYALRRAPDAGSRVLLGLIHHLQPKLFLHGHYHDPPDPLRIGRTLCVCLNHPRSWRLPNREGGMALINPETLELEWPVPVSA